MNFTRRSLVAGLPFFGFLKGGRMADPLLFPDNSAAKLRQLEDRLTKLERVNRLLSSSIKEGALTVYDGSGFTQAVLGLQDDGTYGILIGASSAVPAIEVDATNGITYPQVPIIFREEPTTSITLSSFAEYSHSTVVGIGHKGVYVQLQASTDVGTVGEVRILRTGTGAVTSNAVTVPSDSFLLTVEFYFLHGATLGGTAQFVLQARRVSGAGQFLVNDPKYAALVGPEHCSATGVFVP